MIEPQSLTSAYSKRAFFGFAAGFLILAYGGVGMVAGFIEADAGERLQQSAIGMAFLAGALVVGAIALKFYKARNLTVLSIDDAGVWDRRLTRAPIPWSAIAEIRRIEPSFMERLALLGMQGGKLMIDIRPEAFADITPSEPWVVPLHRYLLAGPFQFRIVHRTLDVTYPLFAASLMQIWENRSAAATGRDQTQ